MKLKTIGQSKYHNIHAKVFVLGGRNLYRRISRNNTTEWQQMTSSGWTPLSHSFMRIMLGAKNV